MRRLVLLNASTGPWSAINTIKQPILQVRGLKEGTVRIELIGSIRDSQIFDSNGDYALDPGQWARIHATHPCSTLMCFITSAKAA